MPPFPVTRAGRIAGELLEDTMQAHHRRRLRNLGHAGSYDPPDDGRLWAAGGLPPRPGNAVDVLVDGAEALPAIVEAIRSARRYVHIAGSASAPSTSTSTALPARGGSPPAAHRRPSSGGS